MMIAVSKTIRAKLIAAILCAVTFAGCSTGAPGSYKTDADRAYDDAVHNRKMVEAQIELEDQRGLEEATNKLVYALEGDAIGDLWDHCTYDPPKQPANQKRCQTLLARVQKDIAANHARIEAKKKAW